MNDKVKLSEKGVRISEEGDVEIWVDSEWVNYEIYKKLNPSHTGIRNARKQIDDYEEKHGSIFGEQNNE
jgi:hypothetical protein